METLRERADLVVGHHFGMKGVGVGVLVAFFLPVFRSALGQPSPWLGGLASMPALIGGAWLIRLAMNRRLERRLPLVSRAFVEEGMCGACGYTLRELAPEADGCAVCPECGGAWSLKKPGPPAPESVDPASPPRRARRPLLKLTRLDRRLGGDDRGLPVALMAVDDLRSLAIPGMAREDPRAAVAWALVLERTGGARRRVAIAGAVVLGLIAIGLVVVPESERIYLLLPGAVLCVGLYVTARCGTMIRTEVLIAACREAGVCAGCGRELAGGHVAADGCVDCACGAAWRPAWC